MKPLLSFFLLVPMYGATLVTTSVTFTPFSGNSSVIDSCSGAVSCTSSGPASAATATAGQEVTSSGLIGYSAHAYALADLPYMTADAHAVLDEWLTFSGNVLYSVVPITGPNFLHASVTVDAPKYTGDLSKVSPSANEAWLIQPGVPVHVLVQATAHASNWTESSYAVLIDPEITLDAPVPEPGTIGLLSIGMLLYVSRNLHRSR